MARSDRPDEPGLFDLPLDPPARVPVAPEPPAPETTTPETTTPEATAPARPKQPETGGQPRHSRAEPPPSSRLRPAAKSGEGATSQGVRPTQRERRGYSDAGADADAAELPLFEGLPRAPDRRDLGSEPPSEAFPPFPPPPAAVRDQAPSPLPAPSQQLELDPYEAANANGSAEDSEWNEGSSAAAEPRPAGFAERWLAGIEDLALHGAVLLIALAGTALAGIPLASAPRGPWLLFLAVFSLPYTTISLAFWGATPGMARRRLVARTGDGEPLSFSQTARRWLGGVLTLALLGLPSLPLLWGAPTLSDRLSGSLTWYQP